MEVFRTYIASWFEGRASGLRDLYSWPHTSSSCLRCYIQNWCIPRWWCDPVSRSNTVKLCSGRFALMLWPQLQWLIFWAFLTWVSTMGPPSQHPDDSWQKAGSFQLHVTFSQAQCFRSPRCMVGEDLRARQWRGNADLPSSKYHTTISISSGRATQM